MGHKGFEVNLTLGRSRVCVTRLESDMCVRLGAPVKKGKRVYSISEGTLDIELLHQEQMVMRTTTSAAPIPSWVCESEVKPYDHLALRTMRPPRRWFR